MSQVLSMSFVKTTGTCKLENGWFEYLKNALCFVIGKLIIIIPTSNFANNKLRDNLLKYVDYFHLLIAEFC
jgi:hypothetical protein